MFAGPATPYDRGCHAKASLCLYAQRLQAGAARGGEAVAMVENIRNFYDILSRQERPYDSKLSLQ